MPSMIGCHALVFTGEFDTRGIASSVQRARAAGFDLIEFPLMEPDTFDSAAARRSAEAAGLHTTASLGLPLEADISSDDPSIVAAGQRLLNVALDRTAEMGGSHMCGVLYGSMRKHMAPASATGRASSVDAIRSLAARASSLGVRLSLEVVNRYETNLINTGRQALEYMKEVDRPDVSVRSRCQHTRSGGKS
jgi:D-psicose/D-tagatose/L-ribulose 3-epimerase